MRLTIDLLRLRIARQAERLLIWLVWHLPREAVKWAFVRVAAHATTGEYGMTSPDELSVMEALRRWGE